MTTPGAFRTVVPVKYADDNNDRDGHAFKKPIPQKQNYSNNQPVRIGITVGTDGDRPSIQAWMEMPPGMKPPGRMREMSLTSSGGDPMSPGSGLMSPVYMYPPIYPDQMMNPMFNHPGVTSPVYPDQGEVLSPTRATQQFAPRGPSPSNSVRSNYTDRGRDSQLGRSTSIKVNGVPYNKPKPERDDEPFSPIDKPDMPNGFIPDTPTQSPRNKEVPVQRVNGYQTHAPAKNGESTMSSGGYRTVTTRTYRYGGSGAPETHTETRTYNYGGGDPHTITTDFPGGGQFPMQFNIGGNSPFHMDGQRPMTDDGPPKWAHPAPGRPQPTPQRTTPKPSQPPRRAAPSPSPRAALRKPCTDAGSTERYQKLKADCLQQGSLFEDPDFPACNETIFYSRRPPRPFEWKRPHEITDDPQLFVGGASRFDVVQGELGDCWLLAAVASLSLNQDLLYRVIPPDQSFSEGYAGIFHFQFWQYGHWVDVVIDDRLPTYYGKLTFLHSAEKNEFWTPLLEKAYAKLHGSYEALKGGSTSEAMEDFTGGVTEMFDLQQAPQNLFQIMLKAFERNSLMGCSIEAQGGQLEAELANGLIMGHAYSITNVKLVDIKTSRMSGKIPLIRVRNPWGNEAEWKGAWSDKSPEWNFISQPEREEMGLTFDDDGEFWMSFKDFQQNFQKLEICNLGPDALDQDELTAKSKKKWEMTVEEGAWRRRVSAGGCRNYLDTFWTNPQYRVTVTDPDEDDDEDTCTIIIGLMQKERRKKRKEGLDLLTMGYAVYKLKDNNCGPLDVGFFKYNASFAKSPSFINMREVCGRHKLPPGMYAIIPSTFEPDQEGEFLLRIFSEKSNDTSDTEGGQGKSKMKSIDEQTGMSDEQPNIAPSPKDNTMEKNLHETFCNVAGEDMEIDGFELRDVLNKTFMEEFKFDGFSLETCRSMVAMMDIDHSGKLEFDEFQKLWNDLRLWKSVFKQFDKDQSGTFNSYELRLALNNVGIRLSNQTFNALVMRYSQKNGTINFDDFILCAVRLKTMFETFKAMDQGNGQASFNMDQFILTTMYS